MWFPVPSTERLWFSGVTLSALEEARVEMSNDPRGGDGWWGLGWGADEGLYMVQCWG